MTIENNFSLTLRSEQFNSLIQSTFCTDANANQLDLEQSIQLITSTLLQTKARGGKIYVIGNGGSAAVAAHAMTDFVNACELPAFIFHEPSIMTCLANDYGYELAFKKLVKTNFQKKDVLFAISSSGKSANIHNAVISAKEIEGTVITLSGFNEDNTLRSLGNLNIWLNSKDYGFVEIGHLFILHNISDRIAYLTKSQKLTEVA